MIKQEALIIALCITLVSIGTSHAKVYEWVDENGVLHMTDTPPPEMKRVTVYGRDACGYTYQMKRQLDQHEIPFVFQSVDHGQNSKFLHSLMDNLGHDKSGYPLPVIFVNGELLFRPKIETVIKKFNPQ